MYKFVFIALVLFSIGCTKNKIIKGDPKPSISFNRFTKNVIAEFDDSVYLYINYTDGDGDLGEINPDINALEIKDSRLPKPDYYFVAPLAPIDAQITITGQLRIQLKSLFLIGTGNTEIASFDIRIKDRAGNWSNSVHSPDIRITR